MTLLNPSPSCCFSNSKKIYTTHLPSLLSSIIPEISQSLATFADQNRLIFLLFWFLWLHLFVDVLKSDCLNRLVLLSFFCWFWRQRSLGDLDDVKTVSFQKRKKEKKNELKLGFVYSVFFLPLAKKRKKRNDFFYQTFDFLKNPKGWNWVFSLHFW